MTRDSIYNEIGEVTKQHSASAKKYGLRLVAYEVFILYYNIVLIFTYFIIY